MLDKKAILTTSFADDGVEHAHLLCARPRKKVMKIQPIASQQVSRHTGSGMCF